MYIQVYTYVCGCMRATCMKPAVYNLLSFKANVALLLTAIMIFFQQYRG